MGGTESCFCEPCDQSCRRNGSGRDSDSRIELRTPPILQATTLGDLSSIKSILALDPRAAKTARDARGNTVLHIAAAQGCVDIFSYLVNLEPDLLAETNE